MRTGLSIDDFDKKPKSVQQFLLASMSFQLDREREEYEQIKAEQKRKSARRR